MFINKGNEMIDKVNQLTEKCIGSPSTSKYSGWIIIRFTLRVFLGGEGSANFCYVTRGRGVLNCYEVLQGGEGVENA